MTDLRLIGFSLVLMSVVGLTVTQIVIKSRLGVHGAVPLAPGDLFRYGLAVVQDWKLVGGLVLLVVAALCWYAGVSRIPLSVAFPVAALSYPLIFAASILFLGEPFKWTSLWGNLLVVLGVILATRG